MPISLRLPTSFETQLAQYSAQHGISKSAVIVRSIEEFIQRNAQPTSFEIYEAAMREKKTPDSRNINEFSPQESTNHKRAVNDVLRRKHAVRSARAKSAK